MRNKVAFGSIALLLIAGCNADLNESSVREAVKVTPSELQRVDRDAVADESRFERKNIEVAEALPGAGDDPSWMPRLRRVCEEVQEPEKRTTRHTEGWEAWQSKLDIQVKDLRLFSPSFSKWTVSSVGNEAKVDKVRARGPFYGYGLTVEVENKSDQVLSGDNIYVWVTYKSKTGERVCFADATANRSFNPFAKPKKSPWIKEKEFSEWPLRPNERKRYTVVRTSCFNSIFVETEPTEVTVEVYMRFRPLGGDKVIAGPLKTYKRDGELLRGMPLADQNKTRMLRARKAPVPVRALFTAADHVLVVADKKSKWVPFHNLVGVTPDSPLETVALPATPKDFSQQYGNLTLKIDNWGVSGWRDYAGLLKQGHKLLTADVEISVDTSSITQALQTTLNSANELVAAAQADVAAKEAGVSAAETVAASVAGTEAEAGAKAGIKAAKASLKTAQKALKAAAKGQKAATKSMAGGVSKFLKVQAKAIGCGSFKVDVGRGAAKPHKKLSTLTKKSCKPLLAGQTVKGKLAFDLSRWDLPFMVSWTGPGKTVQTHSIASKALAKILKD
ncbi:MAG: hypothetical protein ACI9WU_002523 [Myxococcota bacterium]|jgi:hypothetical protein